MTRVVSSTRDLLHSLDRYMRILLRDLGTLTVNTKHKEIEHDKSEGLSVTKEGIKGALGAYQRRTSQNRVQISTVDKTGSRVVASLG